MEFSEAVKLANSKKGMVGKKVKGATLDEIIVVPTNEKEFEEFERKYIQTLNAQQSVLPFINSDVEVIGVCDKSKIREIGALALCDLSEIED